MIGNSQPRHPALLLLLLTLSCVACGRRGPPVAPDLRLPAVASGLTGTVQADGVTLQWNNPTRRADNRRLRDLSIARVFRAEDSGAGDPKPALLSRGRIAGYTEVTKIPLASPAPAIVQGTRVTVVDRQALAVGRRYTYVVITEDAVGRVSPPSQRLTLTFIAAPEPPRDVVVEAGEAEARLAWSPPSRLVDGSLASEPLSYEVLRAGSPEAPLQPVSAAPIVETRLVDRGLTNERTYYYAVRAIRTAAGSRAIGDPTPRVAVTPADMTPPSPPGDLVAIPSVGTVRLSWRPSPEPDVAGYIVYRASPDGAFGRVGSTRAPTTVFVDRDVPPGPYRYVVTAEDSGSRRNQSGYSNAVTVSVP